MNDPHVERLTYRVMTPENVSFANPPPVEGECDAFRFRLADGLLNVEMKAHFTDAASARKPVDEFLDAWELDAALTADADEFSFRYQGASIIDRNPGPTKSTLQHTADVFLMADAASVQKVADTYPTPPADFKASPDARSLWHRYRGYKEGKESLASMGYACFSWLQAHCLGRGNMVVMYNIHPDVLDKLGKLTSDIGTPETARKFDAASTYRAHTATEVAWILAAIKALIRREAEFAGKPSRTFPPLTMTDLPPL